MFSKLGRFEIKGILGRGAMGEVYLGLDPALGREVAIKTILASSLSEDQARQRFNREAQAAAVLTSPNIVIIHELGEDQGVLFIAMERLKGQDLEQILLQRSLALAEFLEVLAQVCDGLDTAHRNHIVHRDIKPSNIMVMREGRRLRVKIMDFGVARLKDSAMTVAGTVMGTVNYIAPEYIKGAEPDARSDLFAVGVMLYECIAGRKPFDGASTSDVLYKIVNDPPDPLELSMLQGLNPALRNMTERALAKDPEERFQSGEEFAAALRAFQNPAWNGKTEVARGYMPRLEAAHVHGSASAPTTVFASAGTLVQDAPKASTDKTFVLSRPESAEQPSSARPVPFEESGSQPAAPESVPAGPSKYTTHQILVQPEALPENPPAQAISAAPPAPLQADAAALPDPEAARAGTQETIAVPPEIAPGVMSVMAALPVVPPEPPRAEAIEAEAAKAGTQETIAVPREVVSSAMSATAALPVAPLEPPRAVAAEAEAAKAGTQETIAVPPEVVPSAMSATAALLVAPLEPPRAEAIEAEAAKAGTQETIAVPPEVVSSAMSATAALPVAPPEPPGVEAAEAEVATPGTQETVAVPPAVLREAVPAEVLPVPPPEIPTAETEPAVQPPLLLVPPDAVEAADKAPAAGLAAPRRSHKGLIAAAILAALGVLGGAGYYFLKGRSAAPSPAPIPPPSAAVPPAPPIAAPPPEAPAPASAEVPPPTPSAPVSRPKPAPPKPKVLPKAPAPVQAPKKPEPAPAPTAAATPPVAPAAASPMPAAAPSKEKSKKQQWAEEATRKRMEQENNSKK